jgi:hypothetical protein
MNALLATLSLILAGTLALTVHGGAAAVLVCACAALVAAFFISMTGQQKGLLLQLFLGGLLVRAVIGTIIYLFGAQEFFGGDALTYDFLGRLVLDFWHGISPAGIADELGSSGGGRGMVYLVAAIYAVTGPNMLAVQLFNAVLGAATAPLIFLCARHIFGSLRVARMAGLLVAFFPSLVLWSSQGLKDGPIVFLLAAAMLATLKLGERLSLSYLLLLIAAMFAVLSMRFYVFYMVAAAVAGSFLVGMRALSTRSVARQFAVVLFAGLTLTYLGVLRTASLQIETFGNLQAVQQSRADLARSAKSGFGQDVDVSTTSGALSMVPVGVLYLLFAPFPWQLGSLRQSITLPEMLAWWAAFPLLAMGVWFTIKYRLRQALPILLFTTMLTLAYSVFQGNVGTAYRQRSQILVFYFIFVAVGAGLLKEKQEDRERERLRMRETARERNAAQARPHEDAPAGMPSEEAEVCPPPHVA